LKEGGGPNQKKAVPKMGILEPKLKQKFKKVNTPKSKQKTDFCSPRKFKSLRDMFRDMEGGCKTPKVPEGSNCSGLSVLDGKCDNLGRNIIPNSDFKDNGPTCVPLSELGVSDSFNTIDESINKILMPNPVNPARIDREIEAKSPRILSLKKSENSLSYRKKVKKAGESQRLNLPNKSFSHTTRPKEGDDSRTLHSGWNRIEKVDLNDAKQDASRLRDSKGIKQIDGGSKSQFKKITNFFEVQHDPTENAGTRVGSQTNQFKTSQPELATVQIGLKLAR